MQIIQTYDKTNVGRKIARGGDSVVYLYDKDQVIKFSSFSFLVGNKMNQKLIEDYEICKEYFGDYIVETNIARNPKNNRHIEIQTYINGKPFDLDHSKDNSLVIQLKEIAGMAKRMQKDGHPVIDLVGVKGMFKLCLSNVFVDRQGKLKIIDATFMEASSMGFSGFVMRPLVPLFLARQRYVLKRFLGT